VISDLPSSQAVSTRRCASAFISAVVSVAFSLLRTLDAGHARDAELAVGRERRPPRVARRVERLVC